MIRQKALAEALGLSVGRIRQLEKMGVVDRQSDLGANVQSYTAWRVEAATQGVDDDGELNASVERALLYRVQRQRVELEMAERRGELLPCDEIEKHWCAQVARMKAKLLIMPNRIAVDVANASAINPASAEGLVRNVVYEALAELSTGTPQT